MKIIVGMATIEGREHTLKEAVNSLRNQTVKPDQINFYNNSAEHLEDYSDNAKFLWLKDLEEPVYYFSCDDDIYYPEDYIEKTLRKLNRYNCIVTYHGRKLLGKNLEYYRQHQGFRCLGNVEKDTLIDVAGTGVTAFRTDYFNPTEIYKSEFKRMADCVFSLEAAKQRKKIMVLSHKEGWLRDLHAPYETSCHALERKHPVNQIQHANQIYELNYD